jgi:8-oxo-dGTP diphosphatase
VATVQGNLAIQDDLELTEIKAFTLQELPLGQLSHDHDRQLQNYFEHKTVIE